MEPIFTMQYAEFAVADYLQKKINSVSVFVPASAQEKGIDLLLYRFQHGNNTTCTIQVKMSRTYYNNRKKASYPYDLWFNRYEVSPNADWFILVGIYAKRPIDANARAKSICWDTIMLAFTNKEMTTFMAGVRQKKDSTKLDKMFGFGFDDSKKIFQTRGCASPKVMTNYLIENRIEDIANSFK